MLTKGSSPYSRPDEDVVDGDLPVLDGLLPLLVLPHLLLAALVRRAGARARPHTRWTRALRPAAALGGRGGRGDVVRHTHLDEKTIREGKKTVFKDKGGRISVLNLQYVEVANGDAG